MSYVPFVLMAFRSKINTSTKYTPYRLLYGREINGLENWNDEDSVKCLICKDSLFTDECDCHARAISE